MQNIFTLKTNAFIHCILMLIGLPRTADHLENPPKINKTKLLQFQNENIQRDYY